MILSLALFVLFAITVGYWGFRGYGGILAGVLATSYIVFIYLFGSKLVLKFTQIKSGFNILDKLSPEIQSFNPNIYLENSNKIIVYSYPKKNICLSQGVLDKLNKSELESIIMREIIRIKRGEVLHEFFLKAMCGPLYILFVKNTDLETDYETAKLTGDPETLAMALEKLYGNSDRIDQLRKI